MNKRRRVDMSVISKAILQDHVPGVLFSEPPHVPGWESTPLGGTFLATDTFIQEHIQVPSQAAPFARSAAAACNSCGRRATSLLSRGSGAMLVCPRCAFRCPIKVICWAYIPSATARCKSATCAVCSRTCQGGPLPPHDARSHALSPARLPLNMCNSNRTLSNAVMRNPDSGHYQAKRRLSASASDAPSAKFSQDVSHEEDSDDLMNFCQGTAFIPGCEEVFCKSCAVEDPSGYAHSL